MPVSSRIGLFHEPPIGFLEPDQFPLLHPGLVEVDFVSIFQEVLAF